MSELSKSDIESVIKLLLTALEYDFEINLDEDLSRWEDEGGYTQNN